MAKRGRKPKAPKVVEVELLESEEEVEEPVEAPKPKRAKRKVTEASLRGLLKAIDNNGRMSAAGKKSAKKKIQARLKEFKSK